jgi:putative protease
MGCEAVVLSNETLLSDAVSLSSPVNKGIISYGNIPLMLFKNCPIKNGKNCSECDKKNTIVDRKGIEFPVRCRMGYSELLNSVPVWLADKQKQFKNIDFQILYFTNEDKQRVAEVISAYKDQSEPDCKYTRGLFFRGVI